MKCNKVAVCFSQRQLMSDYFTGVPDTISAVSLLLSLTHTHMLWSSCIGPLGRLHNSCRAVLRLSLHSPCFADIGLQVFGPSWLGPASSGGLVHDPVAPDLPSLCS